MPEGTTTYGDINQRTAAWAATEFLTRAKPYLVLQQFGQVKEMPKNKSDTVKFRRTINLDAKTTPLVEGVTPTSEKIQFEDVQVQLKQYGNVLETTDVVQDLSEDPVLREMMEQAGEQGGRTMEQLTFFIVRSGTNVFYSNGSARTAVNTAISLSKQRAVTRALARNKAMRITSMLDGSVKVGTRPVEAAYVAIGHTDIEDDLRGLSGFKVPVEYGTGSRIDENEVGSCEKVRYITSPDLLPFANAGGSVGAAPNNMVSTGGSASDVYPIIYLGKEAFGCVPLRGARAVTPTVVNAKPSDSDPLAQRTKVGWKAYFACVILNQSWMARLETGVTAL